VELIVISIFNNLVIGSVIPKYSAHPILDIQGMEDVADVKILQPVGIQE
jgi:hypothetical protein